MNAKTKKLFDSIINCKMPKQVNQQYSSCQKDCRVKSEIEENNSTIATQNSSTQGKNISRLSKNCDCCPIVNYQFTLDSNPVWQCPEPWVGDLESAPVLFLSSNPSINRDEVYPTLDKAFSSWNTAKYTGMKWSNSNDIENFFVNRFSATVPKTVNPTLAGKTYVKDLKTLLKNGSYSSGRPLYWETISRCLYAILVGLGIPKSILDEKAYECDYLQGLLNIYSVLSEIVHCKSKSEFGVKYAVNNCIPNYLNDLLDIFININENSKIIVVVGESTRKYFIKWLGSKGSSCFLNNTGTCVGSYGNSKSVTKIELFDFNFNGKCIKMIFAPHPSYIIRFLKSFILYGIKIK